MKTKMIRVSYNLDLAMPIFQNNLPNQIEAIDSFDKGAAWNSYKITLFNHNGTHIDAPNHFDRRGKRISEFSVGDFIFHKPHLIDLRKRAGESIGLPELQSCPRNCDLLLIRTGFWKKRKKNEYISNNPWLHPDTARFIRAKFKKLKAIGIDTISIASFPHLEMGEEAHRLLLKGKSRLLIIEDLNLGAIPPRARIKRFFAVPLFVSQADSMPCTAFAEVSSE